MIVRSPIGHTWGRAYGGHSIVKLSAGVTGTYNRDPYSQDNHFSIEIVKNYRIEKEHFKKYKIY